MLDYLENSHSDKSIIMLFFEDTHALRDQSILDLNTVEISIDAIVDLDEKFDGLWDYLVIFTMQSDIPNYL